MSKIISISGKDYLTIEEAAFYAGVSTRQFNACRDKYRLQSRKFMGKVLYRKEDIKEAIEMAFSEAEEGRIDYTTLYVPD